MTSAVDRLAVRPVHDDEFEAWGRATARGFYEDPAALGGDRASDRRAIWDRTHTVAAFDGERIIGTAGYLDFTMSVPGGGPPLPNAGVTVVTVASDWRRRGVLTRMMRHLLDVAVAEGRPLASLYVSEAGIYGRYGFGIATEPLEFTIGRTSGRLRRPRDVTDVVLVDAERAQRDFPALYASARTTRGGMHDRAPALWRYWLGHDPESQRDGYSPRYHALLPGRGYVIYRVKDDWDHGTPQGKVAVSELIALDDEAYPVLLEFLLGLDLIETITLGHRPGDDPLPFLVADYQRTAQRIGYAYWLRILDLHAAFAGRGYGADGRVAIEVHDPIVTANTGVWGLAAGGGVGELAASDGPPDVRLDIAALSSVYLGGVSVRRLVAAGLVEQLRPGAAQELDRMLAPERAPWNAFEF